jgi:trehalose synthase-fused probable maltokinase
MPKRETTSGQAGRAGRSRAPRGRPAKARAEAAGLSPDVLAAGASAALPAWLPGARWFGGKARTIRGVTPLDHAALPGTAGILALFAVAYADGGEETYQVPVLPDPERAGVQDALEDEGFCRALLGQIRQAGTLTGTRGRFRFAPTELFAEVLPAEPEAVKRLRAEQTNTSVVCDQRAILKLFRRLEPGPNPDFEITGFLTRQTDFRGIPRLAGSIAYERDGHEPITLAVLQEFVLNQGDAWTATLARLGDYFAAAQEALEAEGGTEAFARALADADAEEARRLGALTGQLHMALASATEPPLAPETASAADVIAWRDGMAAYLERVLQTLSTAHESLPSPARDLAHQVLEEAPGLRDSLGALAVLESQGISKIRIHGDYHLGQVLKVGEGFVILDFEGEPARPLAERRAPQCALKDVAGMLRSFAYAAQSGLAAALVGAAEEGALAGRLPPWAERWESGVRGAFLEGYLAQTWERGAAFLPRDRDHLDAVLRVFEVDKALYELQYEMNNRPAWVRIPLEGLHRAGQPAPRRAGGRLCMGEGPFAFTACLELLESLGVRAENERQLADLIDEVPLDSIYYHTHGFFLRHKFVAGAYPNDFATWAAVQVRDRVLGERLAMVDPAGFANLQGLREELVSIIDDHLRGLTMVPGIILGEPFEFIQSRIVEIPTGVQARSLQEFRDGLLTVDVSAIYFHLVEARLRLGRGQNDFAAWLEHGLDLPKLAARARALDVYAGSLERTRGRLIQLLDEALDAGASR